MGHYPQLLTLTSAIGRKRNLPRRRVGAENHRCHGREILGTITVGRYFVELTTAKGLARRVLRVDHELEHIRQHRAGLGGPGTKAFGSPGLLPRSSFTRTRRHRKSQSLDARVSLIRCRSTTASPTDSGRNMLINETHFLPAGLSKPDVRNNQTPLTGQRMGTWLPAPTSPKIASFDSPRIPA